MTLDEYESLRDAIESWSDKPLSELPQELIDRVIEAFRPMEWDTLSIAQRLELARQWDFWTDPTNEEYLQIFWGQLEKEEDLCRQLEEWRSVSAATVSEITERERRIADLEAQISHIRNQHYVPDDYANPGFSERDSGTSSDIGEWLSRRARHAAEVRHSQPGGSREKHKAIRRIWASGKYTSRDRCAEEECAALGMSYSAARKALRNQPKPEIKN